MEITGETRRVLREVKEGSSSVYLDELDCVIVREIFRFEIVVKCEWANSSRRCKNYTWKLINLRYENYAGKLFL